MSIFKKDFLEELNRDKKILAEQRKINGEKTLMEEFIEGAFNSLGGDNNK